MGHLEGHAGDLPALGRLDQLMGVVAPNLPEWITMAFHAIPGIALAKA